jgi:hypothetical protein
MGLQMRATLALYGADILIRVRTYCLQACVRVYKEEDFELVAHLPSLINLPHEDFLDFKKCLIGRQAPQQTLSNEELINKKGCGKRDPWIEHCLGVSLLNWG